MGTPRKILVVRLGAMGDVIHALPAVARLKFSFPDAHIAWAVESHWTPLLDENPYVDEVVPFALAAWRKDPMTRLTWKSLRSFRRRLRQAKFDLAIDFQGLLKSAVVTHFSRADRVFGFEKEMVRERIAASFYSDSTASNAEHVVDKNLDLATAAGAVNGPVTFPLPPGKPGPALPAGDFVLAAPVAGWASKQWPAEYYAELAERLWGDRRMPLLLDCAPQDRHYVERICARSPSGSCIVHVSSLEEVIAATRRARAVVGVDSGPLHLAAALDVPGVAIYGQTDPARNGPYGDSFTVLRSRGVEKSYQRGEEIHASMWEIRPEQVWDALANVLHASRAGFREFSGDPSGP